MPEKTWKRRERQIRAQLKLERDTIVGQPGADGVNDWLIAEIKCRKSVPAFPEQALQQAERRALNAQLPIAVIVGNNRHLDDALVVMRYSDFRAWFGNGKEEEEDAN